MKMRSAPTRRSLLGAVAPLLLALSPVVSGRAWGKGKAAAPRKIERAATTVIARRFLSQDWTGEPV
jgi:hypothetical protein